MLIVTGMSGDFFRAVRIGFGSAEDISKTDVKRSLYAVITVMLTALFAGSVSTVTSVINTFVTTSPTSEGAMHVALAVGMLGILYAVGICVLLLPIFGRVLKSLNFT